MGTRWNASLPPSNRRHLPSAKSPLSGDYFTRVRRHIQDSVRRALTDTPVVLLNGARQTGKTTLAQALAAGSGAQYFTLVPGP